ncbi:hypothetical protein SFBM_0110 [Candidatus Arthromitus sp. SFB-mouse-Japan]|uniref:SHOCT domain-containing protein n=1 Tax=Candidatus Arthromitus sp. SFB-mouse TaxID=49118 RepID=UPI00021B808A|nr:SHOCT domain-containing protein [Candidatus Arthromitus sp. SFB-mouse]EIA23435.1 hypothetical protein SFB1_163G1 [Candidatus Arthromitus sp. SFB-1]EIA25774.1 hypothetical protein SFB4_297G4 [Candidatus Arthromitus sp. SFB-4]EIA26517.1 hypothetical protein SFB5_263G10 [Candidatus Arthromitus sp. SFB-5]EIA28086.1 hypothetical protein SFB6_068G0 [Candidatus Arthromitus sp. SFB-co]EIA31342.1 hypothetical protein SFBSU_002G72 [Candidatus Arthromitus sp. SFB-mouse-SU]
MGLFGSKKKCVACGVGDAKHKIANKEEICKTCTSRLRVNIFSLKKLTSREIKEFLCDLDSFTVTKSVSFYLEVDEKNKKFLAPLSKRKIYDFSQLVDFELLEDGESLAKGGLGRALVGGALFGGVGAIVGGVTGKRKGKNICNSLRIKITLDDISDPVLYIDFINVRTDTNNPFYKNIFNSAQECLSILQVISNNTPDVSVDTGVSSADEILKFKDLLDKGVITQEEFDLKKKDLLGL